MEWLGNLVGGLFGAAGSVGGAEITAQSQQAMNAANIQQAQWAASGGYLPGLVANAQKAGISPLAALGIHSPGMPMGTAPDRGSGVAAAARQIGNVLPTPHDMRMMQLQEKKASAEVDAIRAGISQSEIQEAVQRTTLDFLQKHPGYHPEGATAPSLPEMGETWLNKIEKGVQDFGAKLHSDMFEPWGNLLIRNPFQ